MMLTLLVWGPQFEQQGLGGRKCIGGSNAMELCLEASGKAALTMTCVNFPRFPSGCEISIQIGCGP